MLNQEKHGSQLFLEVEKNGSQLFRARKTVLNYLERKIVSLLFADQKM